MNDGDEYFYDKLEWVRVRVEAETWSDLSPVSPAERTAETIMERKSPYTITVLEGKIGVYRLSRTDVIRLR